MSPKIGARSKHKTSQVWGKHRDSQKVEYVKMAKPHGGNKQIILYMNKDYDIEGIKRMCINLFKNELVENYFTKCTIQLATDDGEVITEFISKSGDIGFWNFSSKISPI